MKQRCYGVGLPCYKNHGARGISVCDRWRNSFQSFRSDMGPRPNGMSLERIDNNGNYEPGNCKWATRKEQRRNTRTNRLLTFNGKTQPQSAWAEETGIQHGTIYRRLKNGWTVGRALTVPVRIIRNRAQ